MVNLASFIGIIPHDRRVYWISMALDLGGVDVVAGLVLVIGKDRSHELKGRTYAGKMPTRSPIRPVHQSSVLSVRLRIVMISPFLKPRSPSWSASNVYSAIA